jgi:hypothetical protein
VVYLVTHPLLGAHKIGIAGQQSRRLDHHRSLGWHVYRTMRFESGADAYRVEQAVLRWMREERRWAPHLAAGSGWTETVDAHFVSLEELWREIFRTRKRLIGVPLTVVPAATAAGCRAASNWGAAPSARRP